MNPVLIVLVILGILLLAAIITAYVAFRLAFYVSRKPKKNPPEFEILSGKAYEPFREEMIDLIKSYRKQPRKDFSIQSFDGLTLWASYFETNPDAPIELMFHGYRGSAERDLGGGIHRCFALGHNALVVDQRTSKRSDGKVISFGINERKDCLAWVTFLIQTFGKDVKIILTGISMGAATVLMANDQNLPENVIGILADCGYNSPKEIIKKVIETDLKLPANLLYPFVKLGAKIFGGFDLEETSPLEAVKQSRIPTIFIHGETDTFVPCYMSEENHEACTAPKKLITFPDAGHGLSFLIDKERYLKELKAFAEEYWYSDK